MASKGLVRHRIGGPVRVALTAGVPRGALLRFRRRSSRFGLAACVLAMAAMSGAAKAEHIWSPPSATTSLPPRSGGSGGWRPAGSTGIVRRLPPTGTSTHEPAATDSDGKKVEDVIDRHPNGAVKVQRQAFRDPEGNWVNHGTYTMRDPDGAVVRSGVFRGGRQHGKWLHHFAHDTGHLFSTKDDGQFTGPFVSEANFDNGHLHGIWSITTAAGKKVIEWGFQHGDRHGKSTWWHPNGQKRLQANYEKGILHGDVREWSPDGELVKQGTYVNGRYRVTKVGWYSPGQKRFEGSSLVAQMTVEPIVDWWTASATTTPPANVGKPQRDGVWTAWHRNGMKQAEGHYQHDLPNGEFTWWYESGKKQAKGTYRAGVKDGVWLTWHPSGAKQSHMEYRQGVVTGKWMVWDSEGKLVQARDFSGKGGATAAAEKGPSTVGQRPDENVKAR